MIRLTSDSTTDAATVKSSNNQQSKISLRTSSSLMNETQFSQWHHRTSLASPSSQRHSAFANQSLSQRNQQMWGQLEFYKHTECVHVENRITEAKKVLSEISARNQMDFQLV